MLIDIGVKGILFEELIKSLWDHAIFIVVIHIHLKATTCYEWF